MSKQPKTVTFTDLIAQEPALTDLLTQAEAHHGDAGPEFCANAVFYGYPGHKPGLKQRLSKLVGWSAGYGPGDILGTATAYDVAYQTLYKALPDCGENCVCQAF